MQLKIEICSKCDRERPIVNRKHKMCQECNWERLHPKEGSYAESRVKMQSETMNRLKMNTPALKHTKPRQISEKQKRANVRIADTYAQMAKQREHVCTGCGTRDRLSHSHLIPRSRRKDLEADPNNITYHCLSIGEIVGCHDIWEHGSLEDKMRLNDFYKNMHYIQQVDFEYYNLLIS